MVPKRQHLNLATRKGNLILVLVLCFASVLLVRFSSLAGALYLNLGTSRLTSYLVNERRETDIPKSARRYLLTSLHWIPENARAYRALGTIDAVRGEYNSAIVMLSKAVALEPEFTAARLSHFQLAELYAMLEKDRETISSFASAGVPHYYMRLVEHYYQKYGIARALAVFDLALELGLDPYHVYYNRGVFLQGVGGFLDEAQADLLEALRINPDGPGWPYTYLGRVLVFKGNVDQAELYFEKAVERSTCDLSCWLLIIDAYGSTGRVGKTQLWVKRAKDNITENHPESCKIDLIAGRELLSAGFSLASIQYLEQVTAKNSSCLDVHFWLGQAYAKQENFEKAIAEYKLAVHLQPKQGNVHLALAQVYLQIGEQQLAVTELREVLRIEPDNRDAREQLRGLLNDR